MIAIHRLARLLLSAALVGPLVLVTGAVAAQTPDAPTPEAAPATDAATTPIAPEPDAVVAPAAGEPAAPLALEPISCVEVEPLTVAEVEGQTERAAKMPQQSIDIVLERTVAQLQQRARGIQVVVAGSGQCPSPAATAVLRSDLVDFRMGNAALRYFVGFGAGTQKVRVNASLLRKDGSVVGEQQIADAKWGGAFGGSNRKGLDDFAGKVAEFAARALQGR
jgi:hypothetical protein